MVNIHQVKPGKAHLQALPTELKTQILFEIRDTWDLRSLAISCKTWYNIFHSHNQLRITAMVGYELVPVAILAVEARKVDHLDKNDVETFAKTHFRRELDYLHNFHLPSFDEVRQLYIAVRFFTNFLIKFSQKSMPPGEACTSQPTPTELLRIERAFYLREYALLLANVSEIYPWEFSLGLKIWEVFDDMSLERVQDIDDFLTRVVDYCRYCLKLDISSLPSLSN